MSRPGKKPASQQNRQNENGCYVEWDILHHSGIEVAGKANKI